MVLIEVEACFMNLICPCYWTVWLCVCYSVNLIYFRVLLQMTPQKRRTMHCPLTYSISCWKSLQVLSLKTCQLDQRG